MNRRKKESGGQALVMVTLALFSMVGMMGLAVDLSWSYFVQRTAQSSADGAALAAVQETYTRTGGALGTITCGTTADCQTHQPCSSFTASGSNLANGCLYAQNNGFSSGGQGGRQEVYMSANISTPAPTVPNVTNIKYWVTVQTVQTIPQLFSAIGGNTQGTVAAIATAAIAGSISPGSFYGMNQIGDCLTGLDNNSMSPFDCGVDVDLAGNGNSNPCYNIDGSSSGYNAKLCAPGGILLSSHCNGSSQAGCGSGSATASGTNWAGQTKDASTLVWAQSGTQISGNGNVDTPANWLPANTLRRNSSADFSDPEHNLPQPPLFNASQPTCAVPGGTLSGTLGPYQYYAVNGSGQATGAPLTISGKTVIFDPTSTSCPGTPSAAPTTSTFSTFTIWGGLSISGGNNTAVTFGAGQYVMAGTSSQTGAVLDINTSGTLAGDSTLGTMFILTNGSYSSQNTSLTMPAALTTAGYSATSNWYQGFTDVKNASGNLYGVSGTGAASPLVDYQNILLWQDRNNANLQLNPDTADFVSRTRPATTTDTSPQFEIEPGGMSLGLRGVFYQSRGAWTYLNPGGSSATANAHLMMVTGALTCGNKGCGNTSIALLGPSAPIIRYVTALIQ